MKMTIWPNELWPLGGRKGDCCYEFLELLPLGHMPYAALTLLVCRDRFFAIASA
jgi:hypothetical protein